MIRHQPNGPFHSRRSQPAGFELTNAASTKVIDDQYYKRISTIAMTDVVNSLDASMIY
jgi:hypothetical protein